MTENPIEPNPIGPGPDSDPERDGLIFAYELDGNGGGRTLSWTEVDEPAAGSKLTWVHLDYEHERARDWLNRASRLDAVTRAALLASDPRPRSLVHGRGLMVILRGVNLNLGADPEDMVSLRIWIEPGRIITLRRRRVMGATDLRVALDEGRGPKDPKEFLIQLIERLTVRMGDVITHVEDQVDDFEEKVIATHHGDLRTEIGELRRMAISLRRHIAPQREAMGRLMTENVEWFSDLTRAHLREFTDRLTRFVEDLDAARDRAAVTQEELNSRLSERMNKTMYLISICTAVFLPLGFLTGLLGINVGGMPGVNSETAFWIVCAVIGLITIIQILVLKRMHWF